MGEGVSAIAQDVVGAHDPGDPHSPALTSAEYALFAQVARTRRVEAGHHLFRRGDLGSGGGMVRLLRHC